MPTFRTSHIVNHTPQQMFDLVADMESYPQFVPLCQSLKVRRRFITPGGAETALADMTVGYKSIRERMTTRVSLDRQALRITSEYVDGPFSHLENMWSFADAEGGKCRVDFYIAYEFRSRTLAVLMGNMFDAAFRKFASAFEARADQMFKTA
jgi:coenzyme Q-binding protein COQ10